MVYTASSANYRTRRRAALTVAAFAALAFWTLSPARSQMPAGDKQITGRVVDDQNQPVAGIVVDLTWYYSLMPPKDGETPRGNFVGETLSDAQGHFVFAKLPAGQFMCQASSPAHDYVARPAPLVIGDKDTQKPLRVPVTRGAIMTGKVVDGLTGKPLADVYVVVGMIPPGGSLTNWDAWEIASIVKTDTQGVYQVRVLPGNSFVGIGRMMGGTARSQRMREAVRRVTADSGQTVTVPDLTVLLRPMIVCVGPDGKPITNTVFRVVPDGIAHTGYITEDHTDDAGEVVLARGGGDGLVQSGSYSLVKGNLAASGRFYWTIRSPLILEIDGRKTSYPDGVGIIKLLPGSTSPVTGKVVSGDGTAIPNALVWIFETDSRNHTKLGNRRVKADVSGAFRVPLDPSREYQVSVRADGFNQVWATHSPLTLLPGQPKDFGTIHLLRADGSIAGTVVDTAGKPIAGVLAYVMGGKTGTTAAVTDQEGNFRVPNIVAGERFKLFLCLHGEAPDSGEAVSLSTERMTIPDVYASMTPVKIVWRPQP